MYFASTGLTTNWRSALRNAKVALCGFSLLAESNPLLLLPASAQKISSALSTRTRSRSNASGQISEKSRTARGSGTLLAMAGSGKTIGQCPLTHTDVKATVSGYMAKVKNTTDIS